MEIKHRRNTFLSGIAFTCVGVFSLYVNHYIRQPIEGILSESGASFPPIFLFIAIPALLFGIRFLVFPQFFRFYCGKQNEIKVGFKFLGLFPCFWTTHYRSFAIIESRTYISRDMKRFGLSVWYVDEGSLLSRLFPYVFLVEKPEVAKEIFHLIEEFTGKTQQNGGCNSE